MFYVHVDRKVTIMIKLEHLGSCLFYYNALLIIKFQFREASALRLYTPY